MSKQESSSITGSSTRRYPRQVDCGGAQLEVSPLRTADREALAALVATLPPHDLLFLRRDISHPKVLDAWMRAIETGELASLVARTEDGTLGLGRLAPCLPQPLQAVLVEDCGFLGDAGRPLLGCRGSPGLVELPTTIDRLAPAHAWRSPPEVFPCLPS